MKPSVRPGEDRDDLILYINENKAQEPYYGLDMLMLVKRDDHYYVYSESGWITAQAVSDVKASYQLLDDDYFVHHTILDFEEALEKDYDLRFPYSLIYNTSLMTLMVSVEDQETLQRSAAIYDQLIEEEENLIAAQIANASDLKRTISFYRWKFLILREMDQEPFATDMQRMLDLLARLDDDHDAFTAESYEMAGDHYAYKKDYQIAQNCFDRAFRILSSLDSEDTSTQISQIVVREKLGDIQNSQGDSAQALASYRYAIERLRSLASDDQDLMVQLATLYQDCGRILEDMKRSDEAGKSYEEEMTILGRITDAYPSKDNEHNYIIGLHNMASFMSRRKQRKSALRYYHQCLNAAYAYEMKYSHVELSLLLAELYSEIGKVCIQMNDADHWEMGYDYLRKNIEIHKNRYVQSHLEGQGIAYGLSIGELKSAYEKAADVRMYTAASEQMAVFDQLYQYYPNETNFRNHLKVHRAYAQMLYLSRNPDYMAQSISLLESDISEARAHASSGADYQEDLSQSLYCLGTVYKDLQSSFYQDRAINYLREALAKSRDDELKNLCGEAIARLYLIRGGTYRHQALVLYQDILERSRFMEEYDVGHAYENIAYYYQVTGDEKRCFAYHQKELSVFKTLYETTGKDHDFYNYVIAFRQSLDAYLRLLKQGVSEKAADTIDALAAQAQKFSADTRLSDIEIGSIFETLGQLYYHLGDSYYDTVSRLFDQAYIYLNKKENSQLVRLEARRGNIDELRQRYDEAYTHYLHEYQMAKKLYQDPDDRVGLSEVATATHNIAMVHYACQRYDKAREALSQELRDRVKLYHNGDEKQRVKIGLIHRYIGEINQAKKQYHAALTQYKIYHYFMPPHSQNAAIAMEKIGNMYRLEKSREGYQQAYYCYKEVYDFIAAQHNDKSLALIIQKLAYVCFKLGPSYADEALALYQEQAEIFTRLGASDEKYRGDYAISLYNQAVILKDRDPLKAVAVFKKAASIFESMPPAPMVYFRLGNISRLMGDLLEEADYYRQAIDYFKRSGLKEVEPYLAAAKKALNE